MGCEYRGVVFRGCEDSCLHMGCEDRGAVSTEAVKIGGRGCADSCLHRGCADRGAVFTEAVNTGVGVSSQGL